MQQRIGRLTLVAAVMLAGGLVRADHGASIALNPAQGGLTPTIPYIFEITPPEVLAQQEEDDFWDELAAFDAAYQLWKLSGGKIDDGGKDSQQFGAWDLYLDARRKSMAFLPQPMRPEAESDAERDSASWQGAATATPAVPAPGSLKIFAISLGVASGEAFEIRALNWGNRNVQIRGNGAVLEPLSKQGQADALKTLREAATARPTDRPAITTTRITAYCAEYLKAPPAAGAIYRVAMPERQREQTGMRRVLRAARTLEQQGVLTADSDPKAYMDSIRQWSVWTLERKFTAEQFAREFVAHTKKNIQAAKEPWTKQIEATIAALVPHRWHDIALVLAAVKGV